MASAGSTSTGSPLCWCYWYWINWLGIWTHKDRNYLCWTWNCNFYDCFNRINCCLFNVCFMCLWVCYWNWICSSCLCFYWILYIWTWNCCCLYYWYCCCYCLYPNLCCRQWIRNWDCYCRVYWTISRGFIDRINIIDWKADSTTKSTASSTGYSSR